MNVPPGIRMASTRRPAATAASTNIPDLLDILSDQRILTAEQGREGQAGSQAQPRPRSRHYLTAGHTERCSKSLRPSRDTRSSPS